MALPLVFFVLSRGGVMLARYATKKAAEAAAKQVGGKAVQKTLTKALTKKVPTGSSSAGRSAIQKQILRADKKPPAPKGAVQKAGEKVKSAAGSAKKAVSNAADKTKKATSNLATDAKKLAATTTRVGVKKGRRTGEALRDKKTGKLSGISKKQIKTGKVIRGGALVSTLAIPVMMDDPKKGSKKDTTVSAAKGRGRSPGALGGKIDARKDTGKVNISKAMAPKEGSKRKGLSPFEKAFAKARREGKKTFKFKTRAGLKTFTTKLKEEK